MRLPSTAGVARLSARRPWRVLGFWLMLIVLAAVISGSLPSPLSGEDSFTNTPESVKGADLIGDRLRAGQPESETVVVTSSSLTVDDPEFRRVVEETVAALAAMDEVVASVEDYYSVQAAGSPEAEQLVSDDRGTTILPVTLAGEYDEVSEHGASYVDTIESLGSESVDVLTVGGLSGSEVYGSIAEEDLARAELFGLPVALVVLVAVFGALLAAGVPLAVAVVSIIVTVGLVTIIGQVSPQSEIIFNMVVMIGLAVGIDYALFIVERYREERRRGQPKPEAIERAGGTATRAILFSGITVVIALTGMFLIPVSVFKSLGMGAILVVLVSVLASMTMIPAMLALLGDRIDWPRRRRRDVGVYRPEPRRQPDAGGFWGRMTRLVTARPLVSVALAVGLLAAAALPALDLRTGQVGVEALPESDVKRAYEILSDEFYAGVIEPVEIVVDGDPGDPAVEMAVARLTAALQAAPLYGPVEIEVNEAGDLARVSAPLGVDGNSASGQAAIEELRGSTVPAAFEGVDAAVYVTGEAAFNLDFDTLMSDAAPWVFAFVLGLSFLLLTLAFRSVVVPLASILMNLLSVGAAYGLLVLVFEKGFGAGLLGFGESAVIATWIPLFLFCILFGLSMDYHVFLLSRIREHYDLTRDNRASVATGLQATGRIITGAAAIMVAVFSAFASGSLVEMQQMGFGLAVAILLDATVIRSALVPAAMTLLGDWNWYLPRWLGWLPDLRVEGLPRTKTEPALGAAPASD